MALLEERQDFTERLLASGDRPKPAEGSAHPTRSES